MSYVGTESRVLHLCISEAHVQASYSVVCICTSMVYLHASSLAYAYTKVYPQCIVSIQILFFYQ